MNNTPISFDNIVSISGQSGLYNILSQANNKGVSVRSLVDNKILFIDPQRTPISLLCNIQVFGEKDNILLGEIIKVLIEKNYIYDSKKNEKDFVADFKTFLPELDYTRVRLNDMKKIAKWTMIIKDKNVEIKTTEENPEA